MSEQRQRTLYKKIWDAHVVSQIDDERCLVHIDRHIVHECTSSQAFNKLKQMGRRVRNPELTVAIIDHIVSTQPGRNGETFDGGREYVHAIRANCADAGIELIDTNDPRQGIVHIAAHEQGYALPGMTLVCGDSHTSTLGGLGCLSWGIGTSEVEHVLATQTLLQRKSKTMQVRFEGVLGPGVFAKDLILRLISQVGVAAGRGYVVEYAGPVVTAMSVEERLTICNMSIELGARAGLVAPDDKIFDYVRGRPAAPGEEQWAAAEAAWRDLRTDPGAMFDREVLVDCSLVTPQVSWGTTPADICGIDERIPDPLSISDPSRRAAIEKSLDYLGLIPGAPIAGTPIDIAFVGSCTNARLDDLKAAASVIKGRRVAPGVRALVVPGSQPVKAAAEALGLDQVFRTAGFEWREPGCSMCVAINDDFVGPGERAISSTNRNFEGRQGPKSRTHLASPATVAASAVAGAIADVRKFGIE